MGVLAIRINLRVSINDLVLIDVNRRYLVKMVLQRLSLLLSPSELIRQ
jgi:hypothetical protein